MSNLKSITNRINDECTSRVEFVQRNAFLEVLEKLDLPANSDALSVSTGDGSWDYLVLSKISKITKITATDIVNNPVKPEDQKLLTTDGDWSFVQVKPDEPLPFESETYQVVYHNDVLEHVHKPYLFIKEQYRVLKRGGTLVLTTPNVYRPVNVAKILFGKLSFPIKIGCNKEIGDYIHVKEYSDNDIKLLLQEAGFVNIHIEHLYLGLPVLKLNLTEKPAGALGKFYCHYLLAWAQK